MKTFLTVIFAVCAISLAAAEKTGLSVINTGRKAVIKLSKISSELKYKPGVFRDVKTGETRYAYLVASTECRGGRERVVKVVFSASGGQLELVAGHPKGDLITWSSLKVNGKEMLKDKGETFVAKRIKLKEVNKTETFTVDARFRPPNRKEAKTARDNAKKNARNEMKKAPQK